MIYALHIQRLRRKVLLGVHEGTRDMERAKQLNAAQLWVGLLLLKEEITFCEAHRRLQEASKRHASSHLTHPQEPKDNAGASHLSQTIPKAQP